MYLWKKMFGSPTAGDSSNNSAGNYQASEAPRAPLTGAMPAPQGPRLLWRQGRKGRARGQFDMPCGVAVTKTGDIVVADTENNRLQIFCPSGQLKGKIGEKGSLPYQLNHPMSVTLTGDDPEHILVTDSVNASVKMFSQEGTFLAQYCECGTFDFPYGVAVTSGQYIVVTDICRHCVIVLYPSGCKRNQFGQYGDGLRDFDHPYFVAVNKSDHIIVSDSGNTSVKIFSMEGDILQRFNMFDFRLFEEHFVLLQGITVDPCDNILVIGNSTVYIAARNGRFWEVLLPSDGLHSPKCIAYSPLGQLAITQSGLDQKHELTMFRYNMDDFRSLRSVPVGCLVNKDGVVVNTHAHTAKPVANGKCKKSSILKKYKNTSVTSTSSTEDMDERVIPET